MTSTTIGGAINTISELLTALETCYWESADCAEKDNVFNLLQSLTKEYIELMKLSVQDHDYPYEVITMPVTSLATLLGEFAEVHCPVLRRLQTREEVQHQIQALRHTLTPVS